jgi:hypothetical protein
MLELSQKYVDKLQAIAEDIQNSDLLAQYLDTEEEAEYKTLCDAFEPAISRVHADVAGNDPLQLEAMEELLLNSYFEGLFLPRILGYSVLRGQLNNQYKYIRPHNHFKNILNAILESSNFEFIKKRIGQTIQIGFALSSDIWITDFINSVVNKRLRYYMQSNKIDKYRELNERQIGYTRYKAQFVRDNYLTADFPTTFAALKVEYPELKNFLMYRISKKLNNKSLTPYIMGSVKNEALFGTNEHIQLMCLSMNFFEFPKEDTEEVSRMFNKLRVEIPEFTEKYLSFIVEMHQNHFELDGNAELKASAMVDKSIKDEITEYYAIADNVHSNGYVKEDVMYAVRKFHDNHEGLSTVNECLRRLIFGYIYRVVTNLKEKEYLEYFNISKIYIQYINIFGNELFSQSIRDVSMDYMRKCLVKFTDKRARDYQDIKKFMAGTFVDLHFLKDKEVVEMFKTRRKRKTGDA